MDFSQRNHDHLPLLIRAYWGHTEIRRVIVDEGSNVSIIYDELAEKLSLHKMAV